MERSRLRDSSSSSTQVQETKQDEKEVLVLKLRSKEKKISWTKETINNENMGKKSSKRCCIYHKNKAFGESDSEESDSDTEIAKEQSNDPGRVKNYQRFHA